MKYTFEKYEFSEKGRVFLGYNTVNAETSEEAKELAQQKLGEDIFLAQIFVPQN